MRQCNASGTSKCLECHRQSDLTWWACGTGNLYSWWFGHTFNTFLWSFSTDTPDTLLPCRILSINFHKGLYQRSGFHLDQRTACWWFKSCFGTKFPWWPHHIMPSTFESLHLTREMKKTNFWCLRWKDSLTSGKEWSNLCSTVTLCPHKMSQGLIF